LVHLGRLAHKFRHRHRPITVFIVDPEAKHHNNKATVKRNLNDKLKVSIAEMHSTCKLVNLLEHTT